ncbi:MAG: hypothetical protein PHP25_00375 [Candidatus Moranbacteria bacterium]|nr:hypothetical protein [Candidatus Moranbacteria bacterium]
MGRRIARRLAGDLTVKDPNGKKFTGYIDFSRRAKNQKGPYNLIWEDGKSGCLILNARTSFRRPYRRLECQVKPPDGRQEDAICFCLPYPENIDTSWATGQHLTTGQFVSWSAFLKADYRG